MDYIRGSRSFLTRGTLRCFLKICKHFICNSISCIYLQNYVIYTIDCIKHNRFCIICIITLNTYTISFIQSFFLKNCKTNVWLIYILNNLTVPLNSVYHTQPGSLRKIYFTWIIPRTEMWRRVVLLF